MILIGNSIYYKTDFENEAELEQIVIENAPLLFGNSVIILDKFKITSEGGAGTIPDAIVINIESQDWYIMEAELSHHPVWDHIIKQISLQLAAAQRNESREGIIARTLDLVRTKPKIKQIFTDAGISDTDIHTYIRNIIYKQPLVAIPIDGIPKDLNVWAQTIRNRVSIWLLQKFKNEINEIVYSFPDDATPVIQTTSNGKIIQQPKGGDWYQWLLENNKIYIGQELTKNYFAHSFTGIVRTDGIEVDGKVMSVSGSSLYCIKKTGSTRTSSNGYLSWKNADGVSLDQLCNE